ncbi:MAG: L-seryl-tRNA(Sec) selenium transferase, partial [Anaerolineales bacterium]|nr:L-seryl-tRNA(Sec) selenium transferase [Anaerolineales bacterium]
MNDLRNLPSVDKLLGSNAAAAWLDGYGRLLTRTAIREVLDEIRQQVLAG